MDTAGGEVVEEEVDVDVVTCWLGKYNSGHFTAHARFIIYVIVLGEMHQFRQKDFRKGSSREKPNLGNRLSLPFSESSSCEAK